MANGQDQAPISAPPAAKITIRTMESDLRALAQSGGSMTEGEEPLAELDAPRDAEREASFESGVVVQRGGSMWELVGVIAGIGVIIAAAALVGYFVVYPWLFSS